MQLIEDAVANEEKIVVFSEFSQVIYEAYKRCKKYNPALITGDVKIELRDIEVQKFQNNEDCKR